MTVSGSNQFQMPPPQSRIRSSASMPGKTPFSAGFDGAGGSALEAERHDVDQVAKAGVATVAGEVEPPKGAQPAEPEIPLPLAAQTNALPVCEGRVLGDGGEGVRRTGGLRERPRTARARVLRHVRDVEVEDVACPSSRAQAIVGMPSCWRRPRRSRNELRGSGSRVAAPLSDFHTLGWTSLGYGVSRVTSRSFASSARSGSSEFPDPPSASRSPRWRRRARASRAGLGGGRRRALAQAERPRNASA